jgi:phosphate transport system substrate-binding protein
MRPFKIIILTLCICLYHTSFLHAQTIKYIGLPVMNAFIRTAAKVYNDVSFEIITKPDNHTFSVSDLLNGADIIGFTDKIDPEFISVGAKFFTIGRDAIGIWVNKQNPIANLSFDDLQSIYSGKIRNWNKYYSSGGLINLFNIPINSPCNVAFKNIVFKNRLIDSSLIEYVNLKAMLLKQVSQTPGGIGFMSISTAKGHKSLNLVRTVPVNNQIVGITNADYPITRPLYLVTIANNGTKEMNFINWVLSSTGQKIVNQFFIGISQTEKSDPE